MTKVGRIFEEEKLEAVKEATKKIARNLIVDGVDVVQIMKYTGMSQKEIEELKEEMLSVTN